MSSKTNETRFFVLRAMILSCLLMGAASATSAEPSDFNASTADFYVATDGNDDWSGTLPVANTQSSDGPFATLARARDAVRELKRNSPDTASLCAKAP